MHEMHEIFSPIRGGAYAGSVGCQTRQTLVMAHTECLIINRTGQFFSYTPYSITTRHTVSSAELF